MTLVTSPVCTCGRTLALIADGSARDGTTYRGECPDCGPAPRLIEPSVVERDEEREAIETAALALNDPFAAVLR